MSMTEKAAYLKGLADGMDLGDGKNEKLLKAIIDTISELAETVDDIDGDLDVFTEQLDAVDEDLGALEDFVYDEDYDLNDDYDDFEEDDETYDVVCPACGEEITIDGAIIDEGKFECPACGELLEFDFDAEEDEDID